MGVHSIQPYALHRVLRQLGRFQIIPHDEYLSNNTIELIPNATVPEDTICKLWHECRFLEPKTMVRDLAKGEVDPKYDAWFGKRFRIRQRPAKRAHVQQFTNDSQEQWGWLARKEGYRVEIGKLKQQIEDLKYENSVQVDADTGKKNRLTQANKALKDQIQQVRMDADNQQRSRSDEGLITGLRNQVIESQEGLARSEACIARIRARWAKGTTARAKHLRQMRRDYEASIEILRETNSTLKDWVFNNPEMP